MFNFKKVFQNNDQSKYKVIELQAENERLKDDLIEQLKSRIAILEALISTRTQQVSVPESLQFQKEVADIKSRPVLRTTSEVINALQMRSLSKREYAKKLDESTNS